MSPAPRIAGARRKVLLVAEAVTLAHIARPLALAAALDPALYDVTLACDKACDWLLANCPFRVRSIHSISSASFLRSLARGSPVYDAKTLRGYVAEDLALIDEVKPDLIVGDFRLSLSVSARLAKIPYAALSNAYWSPYGRPHYVVPSLPMTRFLPIGVAAALFASVRPLAFALHTRPLNKVRIEFGLTSLGWDLRRTYTDADFILYADVPELFPLSGQPESHQYLGPIIWSPPTPRPAWWNDLPNDLPFVYVSLGSSGQARLLPVVLGVLAKLPVRALVATAGAGLGGTYPSNVYVADYLPGDEAAQRARLVICNGGSPTSHQALVAGVPVIGIAGNLDQFLNMSAIVSIGAGETMRADRFDAGRLQDVVRAILGEPSYSTNAGKVAAWFSRYRSKEIFKQFVQTIAK
jgi:UDP:flavonoid glycosyltransferase YjiC (YdhE family)